MLYSSESSDEEYNEKLKLRRKVMRQRSDIFSLPDAK